MQLIPKFNFRVSHQSSSSHGNLCKIYTMILIRSFNQAQLFQKNMSKLFSFLKKHRIKMFLSWKLNTIFWKVILDWSANSSCVPYSFFNFLRFGAHMPNSDNWWNGKYEGLLNVHLPDCVVMICQDVRKVYS